MNDLEFTLQLKTTLVKFNKEFGTNILQLKPGQVKALKTLIGKTDCLTVLPTGYGKSLVYEILPQLYMEVHRTRCLEIIIVPLNAILSQAVRKLGADKCLNVSEGVEGEQIYKLLQLDFTYLIGHPEDLLSDSFTALLKKANVGIQTFIVVDEAHCVIDWGEEFRPKFKEIHNLKSFFPVSNFFAMTATSTKAGQKEICTCLHMASPVILNTTPVLNNNIKLNVFSRPSSTGGKYTVEESYKAVFKRVLHELFCCGDDFPTTIVYSKLQWCGFAFELGKRILAEKLHRGRPSRSTCRIAQYHSPQTASVNQQVLQCLADKDSPLRVVFASVALGMGADLRNVKRVVHAGPPNTIEEYTQEIGRAGRDGSPAQAFLFFNRTDIAPNLKHLSDDVRSYVTNTSTCRRKVISEYFSVPLELTCEKDCCDVCSGTAQEEGAAKTAPSVEQQHIMRQSLHIYIDADSSGQLSQKISTELIEHIVETAEYLESPSVIQEAYNFDAPLAESVFEIINIAK